MGPVGEANKPGWGKRKNPEPTRSQQSCLQVFVSIWLFDTFDILLKLVILWGIRRLKLYHDYIYISLGHPVAHNNSQ